MSSSLCPVADLLVARLVQWGITDLFGYPGGQLTPIYDAIHRTPGVRHRLARHEQAAAFMADGYARATGRPGVCLAVCGPGVFNAATPLASAHTDSIPLLLISGQVPRSGRGVRSGYYHENDQLEACKPFTRGQVRADCPHEAVHALDHAWRTTREGRPGPVLFEVPIDVLRTEVPAALPPLPALWAPPAPSSGEIQQLRDLLSRWQRPLLLAGGGVVASGAEDLLGRLASRLGSPVFHTANGKCALPASHPLAAGMPWRRATSDLTGMSEQFSPLWGQADGLLAIGCRFSQLATGSWTLPLPPSRAQIDIDPAELGRHHTLDLGIAGDARTTLAAVLEELSGEDRTPWTALPSRGEPWQLPGIDVVGPLRRALPPDGIVAADVTRLAYVLMAEMPMDHPRTFLHPAGAVAMGYGLPAALGARAAFSGRKVVAVVGDGGFQMSALELASAVQENLPVVVLLINDRCLTLIKATQERRYERRYIAVDLRNPDFGMLARSFGARYWRVEEERQLEEALKEALAAEVTAVVEVIVR